MKWLGIFALSFFLWFILLSVAFAAPFEDTMCDSDIECEEATGYPYAVAMQANPPKYPRLVGIGCEGTNGPIYAFEEDHLPECREIFAMDWDQFDGK